MIIFNSFTWNENFDSVCSNHGETSAQFTVMKFLRIIVILFLQCCRLTYEIKNHHHGLMTWNINPGWNCAPFNPPLSFFAKIISHVRKRLHLRCSTGFWMSLYWVRDNYLSANFPTQPFSLLSSLWCFRPFSFPTFLIFHETHGTHAPALQLVTKLYWKDWWHLPICSYIIDGQKS